MLEVLDEDIFGNIKESLVLQKNIAFLLLKDMRIITALPIK